MIPICVCCYSTDPQLKVGEVSHKFDQIDILSYIVCTTRPSYVQIVSPFCHAVSLSCLPTPSL